MADLKKLLIVDDSKVMRDMITAIFATDTAIEVAGEAANGQQALEMVRQLDPDVISLDVSMPVMDGMSTLKHLMIETPKPVVMLSSLTLEGAKVAFDALRYGAVDFISKPSALSDNNLSEQQAEIRSKIEYAARVEVAAIKYIRDRFQSDVAKAPVSGKPCEQIVAIGAAEGGYGALLKLIPHLAADSDKAYVATLYVAPEHVEAFASYLDNYSAVQVKCATHDEILMPGVCYLNSGANYMTVHKQAGSYALNVSPAPFASRKGAIDMLLFSAAETVGINCTGIVLSGLGVDGTEGLDEVIRLGGTAIVQDLKTCLCKQMAGSAITNNPAAQQIPDTAIAASVDQVIAMPGNGTTQMTGT